MEFKLKAPIQVMNKEEGRYEDNDLIVVSFTGKKGLVAIKKIQDVIYETFTKTASSGSKDKKETKTDKEEKAVTVDDILTMLEMTGNSENIFSVVMSTLQAFATVGNQKLDEKLQESMSIEDLDDLSNEVLKTFLLPKVISKMNSMKN